MHRSGRSVEVSNVLFSMVKVRRRHSNSLQLMMLDGQETDLSNTLRFPSYQTTQCRLPSIRNCSCPLSGINLPSNLPCRAAPAGMAESSASRTVTRRHHLLGHHHTFSHDWLNSPRCILLRTSGISGRMDICHPSPARLPAGWKSQYSRLVARIVIRRLELDTQMGIKNTLPDRNNSWRILRKGMGTRRFLSAGARSNAYGQMGYGSVGNIGLDRD